MYDHSVDQRKNKWNAQIKLSKVDESVLPDYIKRNL